MFLRTRLVCGSAILLVIASLLIACGGVSQGEYDATKQQLKQQDDKVIALQQQLSAKEKEIADLKKAAPTAVAARQSGVTWEAKPTWTPRPPPTPLPAGVVPPPRPEMPVSYRDPVPFTLYVETLISGKHPSKYGLEPSIGCVVGGVFKRGSKMVWRFEIVDTSTGKRVIEADGATATIKIPGVDDLSAHFSQRAGGAGMPDAPWMWAAGWDIPPDYPLGGLDYSIVVKAKDGRSFTWKTPALIQKVENGIDSRPQIVD